MSFVENMLDKILRENVTGKTRQQSAKWNNTTFAAVCRRGVSYVYYTAHVPRPPLTSDNQQGTSRKKTLNNIKLLLCDINGAEYKSILLAIAFSWHRGPTDGVYRMKLFEWSTHILLGCRTHQKFTHRIPKFSEIGIILIYNCNWNNCINVLRFNAIAKKNA